MLSVRHHNTSYRVVMEQRALSRRKEKRKLTPHPKYFLSFNARPHTCMNFIERAGNVVHSILVNGNLLYSKLLSLAVIANVNIKKKRLSTK
jgi:hypothetical protein